MGGPIESTPFTVGWVGLGQMGLPMATNLVTAGHRVIGIDLDVGRLKLAGDVGIEPGKSLAEVLESVSVLFTMLRTGEETEEVLLGSGGVSTAAGHRLDVVMMSTMDPATVKRLAVACAAEGVTLLDVPVSGGVHGAEAGTLSLLASGDPTALSRVRPVLKALGSQLHVLGSEPGSGQAVKLANQVMMLTAIAGIHEGLAIAAEEGLEPAPVIAAVLDGSGASWPLAHWEAMSALFEEYESGGPLDILARDLQEAIFAAGAGGADLSVTEATLAKLDRLSSGRRGG